MIEIKIKKPINWWNAAPVIGGIVLSLAAILGSEWFRHFFFVSMFGTIPNQAPSFGIGVVAPLAAVYSLYLLNKRTTATYNQAATAEWNRLKEVEKAELKKFENCIKLLDTKGSPTAWHYSLKSIENMMISEPDTWFSEGMSVLLIAGKEFSQKTREVETKKHHEIEDTVKDINQFIFSILNTIINIYNHPNTKKYRPKSIATNEMVRVNGFCIPFFDLEIQNKQGSYRAFIIEEISLNFFLFENCNFGGIVFRDSDLIKCEFLGTKNVKIDHCLISHEVTTDKTTWEAHAESARIKINNCFVWNDDLASIKRIESNFVFIGKLDAELYKTEWSEMAHPKIPEIGYALWQIERIYAEPTPGIFVKPE